MAFGEWNQIHFYSSSATTVNHRSQGESKQYRTKLNLTNWLLFSNYLTSNLNEIQFINIDASNLRKTPIKKQPICATKYRIPSTKDNGIIEDWEGEEKKSIIKLLIDVINHKTTCDAKQCVRSVRVCNVHSTKSTLYAVRCRIYNLQANLEFFIHSLSFSLWLKQCKGAALTVLHIAHSHISCNSQLVKWHKQQFFFVSISFLCISIIYSCIHCIQSAGSLFGKWILCIRFPLNSIVDCVIASKWLSHKYFFSEISSCQVAPLSVMSYMNAMCVEGLSEIEKKRISLIDDWFIKWKRFEAFYYCTLYTMHTLYSDIQN